MEGTIRFDSLAMFHHLHHFESKLNHLLALLDQPKEEDLTARFKKIVALIDDEFYHDILHNFHITQNSNVSRPKLLLHLHCFLECTDSLEFIANFLELSLVEVAELIRELHNTFSIDNLRSRARSYYECNKRHKEGPELNKRDEYLGSTPAYEPKDITEDRRKRLRKKYGHTEKRFGVPDGPI